jgi:hypothetical protein
VQFDNDMVAVTHAGLYAVVPSGHAGHVSPSTTAPKAASAFADEFRKNPSVQWRTFLLNTVSEVAVAPIVAW